MRYGTNLVSETSETPRSVQSRFTIYIYIIIVRTYVIALILELGGGPSERKVCYLYTHYCESSKALKVTVVWIECDNAFF